MTRRSPSAPVLLALTLALGACSTDSQVASSAFTFPIDFSFACEGDGRTVAPENDETAASLAATRMCPDLTPGAQGDFFGVVLDRQPPQLLVMQLNPASGTRRLVDADYFLPGVSGIPVGAGPLRVLRTPDWSAFLVVSASERRVDRVVLRGLSDSGVLSFETSSFALPGTPIEAEVIGDDLVVVPRDEPALWRFALAGDGLAPTLETVALPDRVARITDVDARWLVTWRTRRTVAILDPDGTLVSEMGLVPACRDGLDNDGDGVADRDDPDCRDMHDDDESELSGAPRAAEPLPLISFDGAPSCDNGVDDDGDGATDFPDDLACAAADDDGERLPACADGVDQDGDGATDLADESCYAPWQNLEGQLPDDGPFHATFIDGGEHGRFVYVLDERAGEIVVFALGEDATLTRVDVNAEDADPPALTWVEFNEFDAEPQEHLAIPAVRPPAYRRQGIKNIQITETNASSLSSGRLRGERWDRIIPPAEDGAQPSVSLTPNSAEWKPHACAPTPTDRCEQPALDDATWFAFGANLDGRIQLIEAIRRGTPMHRLAQRQLDPSLREHDITAPRLTRRGTLINGRGEPQPGLPFIGAALEEVLEERVAQESPERMRRYGIWPPAYFEEAPSETWSVSYQGRIPNAGGALGALLDETRFVDANARFCEAGVSPGDILQLEVPVDSADPSLVHTVPVTTSAGECPTRPATTALVELTISEVGMTSLTLDPSNARLRPHLPVLDTDAIEAQRLSLRACRDALERLDERLGLPENLATRDGVAPAELPPTVRYAVRGSAWTAVGSRSGFLHRQRWDRAAGLCLVDESLDARLNGRLSEVPDAVAKYQSCPPPPSQLLENTVEAIAPAAERFTNPSFALDVFPACETLEDGRIAPLPSQQDTVLTFAVTGPHQGSALSIADSVSIARVPLIDFRRQQVQLDTARRRAAILQLRLGNPEVVVVFD